MGIAPAQRGSIATKPRTKRPGLVPRPAGPAPGPSRRRPSTVAPVRPITAIHPCTLLCCRALVGVVIVIGVEVVGRTRPTAARDVGTPGGSKLRALRELAGRTQLWVETEADIGSGYLQRVECGRVAQPGRATVERILAALGARCSERREVLELFGYTVAVPLPSDHETAWAREVSHRELHAVEFPAYALDCAHRLIAWNRFVPHLFGLADDADVIDRLAGQSILAPWFDPTSPLARLPAEPERFLPALVRALRFEMQPFLGEPWCAELFEHLWDLPRFRLIYYLPADPATMRR